MDSDNNNERGTVVPLLLGPKHKGLKVSASGLLGRIARGQRPNKGMRYMLGVLLEHLEHVGEQYYSGNVAVVDEFLQLYCLDNSRPESDIVADVVEEYK
jgi:hypothetical protein